MRRLFESFVESMNERELGFALGIVSWILLVALLVSPPHGATAADKVSIAGIGLLVCVLALIVTPPRTRKNVSRSIGA